MGVRLIVRMQDAVRRRRYVLTEQAADEMAGDGLSIFEVESVLFTGEIIERPGDREAGKLRYVIRGESLDGSRSAVVVSRFAPTGKLVILAVYTD